MKKIFLPILALLLIFSFFVVFKVYKEYSQLEKMDKSPVNLSLVKDGNYRGQSNTDLVKVELELSVKNSKISDIVILNHECGKGKKAEKILNKIIV
ncbi:MAG: hypothetical protein ACRDA4_10135 [Filifactoraceae bacterium]